MTSSGAAIALPSAETAASAMFATTTSASGSGSASASSSARLDRDAVAARVRARRLDGGLVQVDRDHRRRSRASPRRSRARPSRSRRRAGSPRGRSSSSSRQSRVVGARRCRRRGPGRRRPRSRRPAASPTAGRPRAARSDRPVELAPAILPARLDLVPTRVREAPRARARRGVAVGGELELAGTLDLLEALRRELEEPRTQLLGRSSGRADRGADQRNALFSFSKKPSSGR